MMPYFGTLSSNSTVSERTYYLLSCGAFPSNSVDDEGLYARHCRRRERSSRPDDPSEEGIGGNLWRGDASAGVVILTSLILEPRCTCIRINGRSPIRVPSQSLPLKGFGRKSKSLSPTRDETKYDNLDDNDYGTISSPFLCFRIEF